MKSILLTISLIVLIFSGCGHKEGVVTTSKKSYLYFSGDIENIAVSIDEGDNFNLKDSKSRQYSVGEGKHLIKIYRDGVLIIKRKIYLGDGITKEIEIK